MTKMELQVKEATLPQAVEVHLAIPEFKERTPGQLEERLNSKKSLILVAYLNGLPAGYLIAYDKFGDGSLYCWMVGVIPAFRRQGVLGALMGHLERYAKSTGYTKLRIKTRNNRREMLAYLVKSRFYFTNVVQYPHIEDNRIELERRI